MAKVQTIYQCSNCDAQYPKWMGRCTECGEWSTLEKHQSVKKRKSISPSASIAQVETLANVSSHGQERIKSTIKEFDRVLGGGIVPGGLILLGGDPGIGKSTLILQVGGKLAEAGKEVLYVSGEESATQVKGRFQRLGLTTDKVKFFGETDLEAIIAVVNQRQPAFVILDSIQTMHTTVVDSEPGSVGQLRAVTSQLVELAKVSGIPILVIGHVTKQGGVAGPRTLEHMVDVVLYLEGDRNHAFRVLRAAKNRYGSTSEVGVFDMQSGGLREVSNPSEIFLAERKKAQPGSVVTAVIEGSRAFLVEVQALVSRSNFGYPQRRSTGFDYNRLQLLVAVLTKKVGLFLGNQDIHVNVAGGFKVGEPAVDLAVCMAIASAAKNKPIAPEMAVFGEVGLGGEIRSVGQLDKRLEEITKMGFSEILMPPAKTIDTKGAHIVTLDTVSEAIRELL